MRSTTRARAPSQASGDRELISGPFHHGLVVVFAFATVLAGLAALASALRGGQRRADPAVPDAP
jgi:hypothetical protein